MAFIKDNKVIQKYFLIALLASGSIGLSVATIIAPMNTPAAHAANWTDFLPVPTGAYINLGYNKYYYGDLNDPSRIVPGVAWQLNANGTVLLKGYGYTPRAIFDLINKVFFQPVRVE